MAIFVHVQVTQTRVNPPAEAPPPKPTGIQEAAPANPPGKGKGEK